MLISVKTGAQTKSNIIDTEIKFLKRCKYVFRMHTCPFIALFFIWTKIALKLNES